MSNPNTSEPNLVAILSPWVNKPGGLLFMAMSQMISYADYGAKHTATNEARRTSVEYFSLIAAYIASAKKNFTTAVKNSIIDTNTACGAGTLTRDEIAQFVEIGSNMTEKECDQLVEKEIQLNGSRSTKTLLLCLVLYLLSIYFVVLS